MPVVPLLQLRTEIWQSPGNAFQVIWKTVVKSSLSEKKNGIWFSWFHGRTIVWIDEYENASDLSRVNLKSNSNVIDESDWQYEKYNKQRNSTLHGITIDWNEKNASETIHINLESDSIVIDEKDR
jgi:hypothetical protein